MRIQRILLVVISFLVFSLIAGGCALFPPSNNTRPAPVRPRNITNQRLMNFTPRPTSIIPSPGIRTRPAPSKRLRGLRAISERSLLDRVTRIEQAANRRNWAIANRETNTLGLEMTRFRPTSAKGKSLREIARFDAIYAKLQVDVRMRNRIAVIRDTQRLKRALTGLKRTA